MQLHAPQEHMQEPMQLHAPQEHMQEAMQLQMHQQMQPLMQPQLQPNVQQHMQPQPVQQQLQHVCPQVQHPMLQPHLQTIDGAVQQQMQPPVVVPQPLHPDVQSCVDLLLTLGGDTMRNAISADVLETLRAIGTADSIAILQKVCVCLYALNIPAVKLAFFNHVLHQIRHQCGTDTRACAPADQHQSAVSTTPLVSGRWFGYIAQVCCLNPSNPCTCRYEGKRGAAKNTYNSADVLCSEACTPHTMPLGGSVTTDRYTRQGSDNRAPVSRTSLPRHWHRLEAQ